MTKRRAVLSRPTQGERAAERAAIGKLSDAVVSPGVKRRYALALKFFFETLKGHGEQLATQVEHFDAQVCRFIDTAWQEGETRSIVGDILSALADRVPALRRRLNGAWRLHSAWGRLELPCRAWPLTCDQALAMAGVMKAWGYPRAGLVTLIGFDCFLRTGEFLGLTWKQIHVEGGCFISLPETKSSARKGAPEGVAVLSDSLCRRVQAAAQGESPGSSSRSTASCSKLR